MELAGSTSRPKIHRMPERSSRTNDPLALRAFKAIFLSVFLLSIITVLWSLRTPHEAVITQIAESTPPLNVTASAEPQPESIPVQDENGVVVGQLTKMPADIEHGAAISATAKIDQKSGKDLLKIISKY